MYPKWHVVLGLVFSFLVFTLSPNIGFTGAAIIFLSSVFIDVDHYLTYVFRKKDFNLKKAFRWHDNNRGRHKIMHFLHSFEFLLVLGILSIYKNFLLYIFTGFIFHNTLDIIDMHARRMYNREFFFTNWLREKLRD